MLPNQKHSYFIILFLGTVFLILPPVYTLEPNFKFNHIMIEDGLSQSNVLCIYQDRKGFMWFGTRGDINLYNREQKKFTRYHTGEYLVSRQIQVIHEDQKKNLWVATKIGELYRFDENANIFVPYQYYMDYRKQLGITRLNDFLEDHEGHFWFATDYGLLSLDLNGKETEHFVHYLHDKNNPNSLSDNVIFRIHLDRTGKLWIATSFQGINLFDFKTKKFTHLRHDPDNEFGISSHAVRPIFEDRTGRIWIGTLDSGIDVLDPFYDKFVNYQYDPNNRQILYNNVSHFAEDKYGNLWISTDGDGLHYFDRKRNIFLLYYIYIRI